MYLVILRGSGKPYLANVKIVLMLCTLPWNYSIYSNEVILMGSGKPISPMLNNAYEVKVFSGTTSSKAEILAGYL